MLRPGLHQDGSERRHPPVHRPEVEESWERVEVEVLVPIRASISSFRVNRQ